jgi:hypothetical protein
MLMNLEPVIERQRGVVGYFQKSLAGRLRGRSLSRVFLRVPDGGT